MNEVLQRLLRSILHRLGPASGRHWRRRAVDLVIGSDREIGRKSALRGLGGSTQERRVGITPRHVTELRELFGRLEVRLNVLVVENAGARAGFADADFVHAGAEIVTPEELAFHDGPPDVVHALKEPSTYEADLPGPFLRIGALHSGDFHEDSGFARLLKKGNVTVFDGSNIGAAAAFRMPIRGRMSVFAGEIAAEWVLEHLAARELSGAVVVAGGGYAGKACAKKLLQGAGVTRVTICENGEDPARIDAVAREFTGESRVRVVGIRGIDDAALRTELTGAVGVVFAVAAPKGRAPRIVTLENLRGLHDAATVVDISIDERGAILDPRADADWHSDKLIDWFGRELLPRRYQAIANMPRAYPHKASLAHGDAIVPYIAALLYLCAREGGAAAATAFLGSMAVNPRGDDPLRVAEPDLLPALLQDLRNGMAVFPVDGRLQLAESIPAVDRDHIAAMLTRAPRSADSR
ncbi:MAG: hypothetical protein IPK26_07230 [Planctomycetes bacterium]|nr:hypothetical protein [Planctomycetota bacterium]